MRFHAIWPIVGGFSTQQSCYFEIHDTRSGSVTPEILIRSNCEYLLTDVYSGYSEATDEASLKRIERDLPSITNYFCNAHARRYFNEVQDSEFECFMDKYQEIYQLNKERESNDHIRSIFSEMKKRAEIMLDSYSNKSAASKAL
ncbi:MAG: transposase [Pseudobacteriovorax sp.]|nr:transposase [Pseudobacteriovorax sp.]